MAKINVRSPYYVTASHASLANAVIKIFIYTGTQTTSRPATPNYTLFGSAVNTGDNILFEISKLVADYVESTFNGTYTSDAVWVDYEVTRYYSGGNTTDAIVQLSAFNGYGYFEEGINPQLSDKLLISNRNVYKLDDTQYVIPVQQDKLTSVNYFKNNTLVKTYTYSTTALSSDIVRYVSLTSPFYLDYKSRVIADSGTYEGSSCLSKFFNDLTTYDIDSVQINFTDGIETVKVYSVEECKHTPYRITFINKFGVKQSIWFFKRSDLSMSVTKESFKSNSLNIATSSYDISSHQYKNFNIVGKETIKLNSGFVDEDYDEVFRQLMLSEKVWIDYNSKVLPINIKNSSIDYKKRVNEKLINYMIEFDFAFDKINNIG